MSYQLSPDQSRGPSSPPQVQYAEGLEVASAPQGLEVVPPSDPEWTATVTEAGSKSGEKVDAAGPPAGGLDGHIDTKQQVWWKRKRILIGIAIVIVVAIALGVGLGVGLTTNKFVHPNILHD